MALFLGLPGWASTRKVKPIWTLLKQETVSGNGISWAICKSAPRCRQITTPAPHHSSFYRPDALPAAQPTASKHWRPNILPVTISWFVTRQLLTLWNTTGCCVDVSARSLHSSSVVNLESRQFRLIRCFVTCLCLDILYLQACVFVWTVYIICWFEMVGFGLFKFRFTVIVLVQCEIFVWIYVGYNYCSTTICYRLTFCASQYAGGGTLFVFVIQSGSKKIFQRLDNSPSVKYSIILCCLLYTSPSPRD